MKNHKTFRLANNWTMIVVPNDRGSEDVFIEFLNGCASGSLACAENEGYIMSNGHLNDVDVPVSIIEKVYDLIDRENINY